MSPWSTFMSSRTEVSFQQCLPVLQAPHKDARVRCWSLFLYPMSRQRPQNDSSGILKLTVDGKILLMDQTWLWSLNALNFERNRSTARILDPENGIATNGSDGRSKWRVSGLDGLISSRHEDNKWSWNPWDHLRVCIGGVARGIANSLLECPLFWHLLTSSIKLQ